MGSSASNTSAILGWMILLVGIAIGQSNVLMENIVTVLSTFQSTVNILLIPIYSICVVVYLVQLCLVDFRKSKFISIFLPSFSKTAPASVAVQPIPETAAKAADVGDDDGVFNLTGTYKLISNDNFEGFLETQGVPWAIRRAANQARPFHKITHVDDTITIQIKGIIESSTTYIVNGPPVQTTIQSRVFQDRMKYLESGDGIEVTKTAVSENYTIVVTRRLSKDKQTITMTSRAIFEDDREPVQSVQIFQRVE